MLDERDETIAGDHYIFLILSACAATATDPGGIDKLFAQPPTMNSSEFHCVMNVLTDYCQWQECVTADNLNEFHLAQAKVADAAVPN